MDHLPAIVLGCGCAIIVIAIILAFRELKQTKANLAPPAIEQEDSFLPNYVTVHATVTNQACCVRSVGIKLPKTVRIFTIEFQTDDGETIHLDVPEETYDGFEIGQVGDLTTVDGELFSYVLDSDSL